ncbi:filamentous hemagglutinin N-terminal domain-containing protein [Herbaspirillum sp. SJZ099]|uniref:beta strand repeat-containing protein n=1 Tax=Herbaspirillum sp. SJZ099 TaxID=2572916 RepID=UPI0011A068C7|nr:filamentous hemagglutinin N-terminal domain-containing protein [Herbaspirillum sp. SJZ099]TWC68556.1 filamentous hemagglutinin family protein [Herbaspirillum sp. SJZ099]
MKNTVPTSESQGACGAPPAIELLPPSLTVRLGKRRLTLSWRARKPLPSLLGRLLLRSWRQVLAPVLRVSVSAAAVCGAWQTGALAAAPAPGTLPAGWSVVNGNVVFTQNGATLNINQLTPQAIATFQSFSIGSDAVVNISQPGAAAAFLAKVTGGDISQIYGKLTAPGLVALYNPNGILIGPGGTVDVGRFIASTLNINDSDFLAGKLTFSRQGAVGSVENQGTIKSATGGSVYLIGSSVTNGGIIQSPQGEVILAAGETVTLADTATPGVTVNVTGNTGNVTNLGAITAEAGRIGIAAGLISNSGTISASSVVREGGRVFLRASQNLATTASSRISADGTAGGNVTLYSDNKAFIDGDVSAIGAPGRGGFVETSGLKQLDVVKVPTVGSGGTWLIDPYDLTVVSSSSAPIQGGMCGTVYAVGSSDGGTEILNSTINAQLNLGVNVTLTTGNGGNSGDGNITISADIVKSAGAAANLTLNADNNININANITSTSNGLDLALNTRHNDYSNVEGVSRDISIGNGARVILNGGTMTVSDGGGKQGNGNLLLGNGSIVMGTGDTLNAGNVTMGSSGLLSLGGTATVNVTSLASDGAVTGSGTIKTAQGFFNNGTLAPGGDGNVGTLNIDGNLTLGSGSKLLMDVSNAGYDRINFLSCGTVSLGGTFQTRLLNGYTASVGTVYQMFNISAGAQFAPGSYFRNVTGDVLTIGGNKQMIKATTENGLTLAMAGSATLAANGSDSDWGSLATWGGAGYIPTQIDTVVIDSCMTAHHGMGADTIDKLVLNGGSLDMYGGSLTVATSTSGSGSISVTSPMNADATTLTLNNAATDANVYVNSGNLVLGGDTRFYGMEVRGGNVTGNSGSRLMVSDDFYQSGGNMSLADAALSSASGTLTVGNITANNLVLEARNGDISQYGSSCMSIATSLHVTRQLIASATGNISLDGATSNNQIAAFAASSSGQGNIRLLNHLNTDDASVVTVNGVNAANGSVNIENYGAMRTAAIGSNADFLGSLPAAVDGTPTSAATKLAMLGINGAGLVKTRGAGASVNMSTHSPLTIGAGGVDASGDIVLTAGSSANSGADNLIINGPLSSQGGNVTLAAGNSIALNANVTTSAPGLATLSAPALSYAPGVSITDANGVRIPVPLPPPVDPIPVVTPAGPSTALVDSINTLIALVTQTMAQTSGSAGQVSMTSGDRSGTGKEDAKGAIAEERAAPKVAKLYCN